MTAHLAFLFPGQGSQAIGMGEDVFAASASARHVFEVVDQALGPLPEGMTLSTLCFRGPENVLRETVHAQPAIVTVSLALLAALQEVLSPHSSSWLVPLAPQLMAGHSVGEYSALIAAGVLELADGVRLIRERGRLMHAEGQACPGGMLAIIGMEAEPLQEICQEVTEQMAVSSQAQGHPGQGKVAVANYNAPGQIVISGEQSALTRAGELAKERGAKRVIPLSVSGAFHSPVMQPAAEQLVQAIATTTFHDASVPVISNIHASPLTDTASIREELAQQVAAPVQWIRTIEACAQAGVTIFLEIGPGQALTGMVRRIAKDATTITVGNVAEIEKAVQVIRERNLVHDV